MTFRKIDIQTPAGTCDAYVALPEGPGPFPAVLYYMDVGGLRPGIAESVERIAAKGYYVLAPNLFYRMGRAPVADMAALAGDMPKMFEMIGALTPQVVVADAKAYIDFLQSQPETDGGKVAVVGYCMSGGMALRTASHDPDRVAAAASFHGAFLGAEDPDSPHHTIAGARAEIYVGLAAEDFVMPEDQVERLRQALDSSGVTYALEVYPGTQHGWTIKGSPIYVEAEAERHWDRLFGLLERNLTPA
jgi:carboxymethylenebutenolidase